MNISELPSPNFDSRDGQKIDMLVLHYTGMKTVADALDKLRSPQAKVSAHYVVDEDGSVYRMVAEKQRAWHAGVSSWRGNTNINQRSIGIEIVNPGHEFGYRAFPEVQIQAVVNLCQDILSRHPIPARNVVGHSDVAPQRKEDPGELFPWEKLAGHRIGIFPAPQGHATSEKLADYGYDVSNLPKTIIAFQRHFRPALLSGQWDEECAGRLASLLAMI